MRQDQQLLQHGLQPGPDGEDEMARDRRARQVQSSRLRVALFKGLQVESFEERQAALDTILQVVKSYLRSVQLADALSPTETTTSPTSADASALLQKDVPTTLPLEEGVAHSSQDVFSDIEAGGTEEQLHYFLLTILRLAHTCPFRHVRQTFKTLLQKINMRVPLAPRPIHSSPSSYIRLQDIFSLESTTSNRVFVTYPRSSRLSVSPWSHDGEPSDSATDEVSEKARSECAIEEAASTGGRPSDEYVRQMMVKSFLDDGRLSNLHRVLAFFPTFYEAFNRTYKCLIKGSVGPLDRAWKCYIGIMASAELKCQYLVSLLKLEFLQNGGDPTWLRGLMFCPRKLRRICPLVLTMARQPWRLRPEDLAGLMITSGGPIGESWTKSELVQAIVIISTFLSLGSFVLGCGINPELDMRGGFCDAWQQRLDGVEYELDLHPPVWLTLNDPSSDTTAAQAAASSATGWDDARDTHHRDAFSSDNGAGLHVSIDDDSVDIDDPQSKSIELIKKLTSTKNSDVEQELKQNLAALNLSEEGKRGHSHDDQEESALNADPSSDNESWAFDDFSLYIDPKDDQDIAVEDFDESLDGHELFMLGDYCWEDHGSALVNQFMPNLGEYLDEELEEALSITDWSIFHQVPDTVVDTLPLRHAIWHYTEKLFGMIQEDYPYSDIDIYLPSVSKAYIAKVCRRPFDVRHSDWNHIGLALRPEEKCHVNLLITAAKKQALLCFGLYAASML